MATVTSSPSSSPAAPPRRQEPLVLGVCDDLAARCGASVAVVRAAFVVLGVAGGAGLVAYLALAGLWRRRDGEALAPAASRDAGVVLIVTGALWELARWWPGVRPELVVPVGLVSLGVAVGWRPTTGLPDAPGPGSGRLRLGPVALRVAAGAALLIGGLAVFFGQQVELSALRDTGIALGVALGGVAVVLGPTVVRVARSLGAEREQRIRAQERAAVAAHLHDSVLQTLTLIQKRSDDPAATAALARHQERSLRRWLYGGADAGGSALAPDGWRAECEAMVGEVEDLHAIAVELVMVGDGPSTPAVHAALGAAREALVNAAKFSGVTNVSMFCEWTGGRLQVFVRDRGRGFDPAAVDPDRRGVSDSIVGRMRSVGGTASIRTAPGEGTEVAIEVRA